MKIPCETIFWYILPVIRNELAKTMINEYNMTQKEVAQTLDISNAAVSQYLSHKRGNAIALDHDILAEIKKSAKNIIRGEDKTLIQETCKICEMLKSRGLIEKIMASSSQE